MILYNTIDYGLPCIAARISYLVSEEAKLPYIQETFLRYLKITGATKIDLLSKLLVLDSGETLYLVNDLLSNNLISVENGNAQLTPYSESLFVTDDPVPRISKTIEYPNFTYCYNTITNENVPLVNQDYHTISLKSKHEKLNKEDIKSSFSRFFYAKNKDWPIEHSNTDNLIGLTKADLFKYFSIPLPIHYLLENQGNKLSVLEESDILKKNKNSEFEKRVVDSIKAVREYLVGDISSRFNLNAKRFLENFTDIPLSSIIDHNGKVDIRKLNGINMAQQYEIFLGQPTCMEYEWWNDHLENNYEKSKNPIFWVLPTRLPYFGYSRRFNVFQNFLMEKWKERLIPVFKMYSLKNHYFDCSIQYNKKSSFLDYVEIISLYDNVGIVCVHLLIKENFPLIPVTVVLKDQKLINTLYNLMENELNKTSNYKIDTRYGDLLGRDIQDISRIKTLFKKLIFW